MLRHAFALILLGLALLPSPGCQRETARAGEDRQPLAAPPKRASLPVCPQRAPLRDAFFGDLHVHTSASADAYAFETGNGPEAAYAFARGDRIELPGPAGDETRRVLRLARPLDFAAVTDHAEWFAELPLCVDARSPLWENGICRAFRGETQTAAPPEAVHMQRLFDFLRAARRPPTLCDEAPGACAAAGRDTWARMQAAAARWNTPCDFTTFVAYEWSQTDHGVNLHRNVIFRNEHVPKVATSSVAAPTPPDLWRALQRDCLDAGTGCDVLAIPHNSNLSNGVMFEPSAARDGKARNLARQRSRLEPLLEIYQVKGDSECRNGMYGVRGAPDEFCDFEKIFPSTPPPEDCRDGTGQGGMSRMGCVSRRNFARYALGEGMRERARLGVNPFQLGFLAATDTHNAIPGAVSEADYPGSLGVTDASIPQRLAQSRERPKDWAGQPMPLRDNPGGLAGGRPDGGRRHRLPRSRWPWPTWLTPREAGATWSARGAWRGYGRRRTAARPSSKPCDAARPSGPAARESARASSGASTTRQTSAKVATGWPRATRGASPWAATCPHLPARTRRRSSSPQPPGIPAAPGRPATRWSASRS